MMFSIIFSAIFLLLVGILYLVSVSEKPKKKTEEEVPKKKTVEEEPKKKTEKEKPKKIRRTACRFCGVDLKTTSNLNRHERWRCKLRLSEPSSMLRLNPDGVVADQISGIDIRLEQIDGSCIITITIKNK